ncbi:MAG: cell division/cell wall cluster transcriptional repressor MraZ [Rhodobacteraceae bacterium]|nr:cell division/cell wall cluster transcriptional repressor MraZ [Paracoccaceae bacterium]
MSLRFRSDDDQGIDGKGRVSIPAAFRPVIAAGDPYLTEGERPSFVIVWGAESLNHLRCYTREEMERIEERIELMDEGTDERELAETFFLGSSFDIQLGEDGRIVLPQRYRKKLELEDRVYFIGLGNHFKIWKPETYKAHEAGRTDSLMRERGARFDPASLLPKLPKKPIAE